MQQPDDPIALRTTADVVFDYLQDKILSLELLPGAKISEADVASQLGVSRQPVRDAFNRLGNLNLLTIRPQRATVVNGFSMSQIRNTRFIRLSVELEVARRACAVWDDSRAAALEANLAKQRAAIDTGQIEDFHQLDYDFHALICTLGGHPLAFETIAACKQQVDRLCVLSLARSEEITAVLADHEAIAQALILGSPEDVESIFRRHLGRLNEAIHDIHEKHSEYFQ